MPGSRLRPQKQQKPRPSQQIARAERGMPTSGPTGLVGPTVISDLPKALSPTKAEIALLRAFLADEIDAILRDGD